MTSLPAALARGVSPRIWVSAWPDADHDEAHHLEFQQFAFDMDQAAASSSTKHRTAHSGCTRSNTTARDAETPPSGSARLTAW
jgi:hypothetical protein